MFLSFLKKPMPTLGAHFPDNVVETVENAAKASPEQKVGPYIVEAVRQRMAREGTLPGNPYAELLSAAEEIGVDQALDAVKRAARAKKKSA